MCPNNFFDVFVSFKCCNRFIFENFFVKFSFICKIFQYFLMVLVIFGRNRLHVITRGILSDFCRVSFSVARSILLNRLILSRCSLINATLNFRSSFSYPWGYYSHLPDLNLFAWFGWLDCKVNYLSLILGVQILCEGNVVNQFLFCVSLCVICCYVDIFQCLEMQYGFSKVCNEIL